jgi:hypothetical protein
MRTLLRRHTTLAAFSLSLAASTAFVACGSDSTTTAPSSDGGDAGVRTGSGGATGTGGRASAGGAANTGGKGGAGTGGKGGAGGTGGKGTGGKGAGGDTVTSNGDASSDAMVPDGAH